MKYVVPKFIERESKVIGPLSLKQFAYVGAAGVICFIIYFSAPIQYFIISVIVLGSISVALAFLKINGRPIPVIIKNAVRFLIGPKEYLWERQKFTSPVGIKKEKVIKKEKIEPRKYKLKKRGLDDLNTE